MMTANVLMEGESLETVGPIVAMVHHRARRDLETPLIVFLPGGGHLARIAYGYPGGEPRDFIDHWLEPSGHGMLSVSPPSNPPFTPAAPDLTRAAWAEAVAELITRTLKQDGGARRIVLLAWSLASGYIGHLSLALRARRVDIAAFVPLAAAPPLPRPQRSYVAEETLRSDGLWDVADSRLFGVDRATSWLGQIASIEAEIGRSVLPEAAYRHHILVGTPVGLARGGLARIEPPSTEEPDIADWPLAAPLVPMDESDHRHGLSDVAGWTYVNTQIVLARYALARAAVGDRIGTDAWRDLTGLVDSLPERLATRLPGGHFFFVGETGARATAAAILEQIARTADVRAELCRLLPPLNATGEAWL